MPADQVPTTKKSTKLTTSQPAAKYTCEHRSDEGVDILLNVRSFVGPARKITRPGLLVDLLKRASVAALLELKASAEATKGRLSVESRQAFFHMVGKLVGAAQYSAERIAERAMLLDDGCGTQTVLSLLNEECADDAIALAAPNGHYGRTLYLHLLQNFPVQGVRRDKCFD